MNLSPELVARIVGVIAAVGLILPHLQALIQAPWWSPRAKAILTVVLSIVGGIVTYVATNGLDVSDPSKIVLFVVGVYTASSLLYARLLRPLGTTSWLEVNAGNGHSSTATARLADDHSHDDLDLDLGDGDIDPAESVSVGTTTSEADPDAEARA